jgi:hypothetical protein
LKSNSLFYDEKHTRAFYVDNQHKIICYDLAKKQLNTVYDLEKDMNISNNSTSQLNPVDQEEPNVLFADDSE